MQIVSAVSGGITDLSFHATGYTWQIINCFLTASYSVSEYSFRFNLYVLLSFLMRLKKNASFIFFGNYVTLTFLISMFKTARLKNILVYSTYL